MNGRIWKVVYEFEGYNDTTCIILPFLDFSVGVNTAISNGSLCGYYVEI